MRQRYFFRHQKSSFEKKNTTNQECSIQIPSVSDMEQMLGMPAGASEDQYKRLTHMTQVIKQIKVDNPVLPIIDTNQASLTEDWVQLFHVINEGKTEKALAYFAKIPKEDMILKALLAVHSWDYLLELIKDCVNAQNNNCAQSNPDLVITPKTFEILIKDIATTLFCSGKIHFSFGLPSHHAFSDEGSGFCILNKTAILIKNVNSVCIQPLKCIIIGTDVNRDNGLCDVLKNIASDMDICHIDVFDSRVYPWEDNFFITNTFKQNVKDVGQQIGQWHQNHYEYYAVDLSLTKRKPGSLHPALVFALDKLKEQINMAKTKDQKIALFLPTGWDSHEEETAACGKYIAGKMMTSAEAKRTRFSESDLFYFYEHFFTLYQVNKECIEKVYWGLEGGYYRAMYEKQVQWLMSFILDHLVKQNTNENVPEL